MALEFDPSLDLLKIADGTEPVTLYRRGRTASGSGELIPHAIRRAMNAAEAAIVNSGDIRKHVVSGGRSIAADMAWILPTAELSESPRLGDIIVDSQGQRWTIMEVKLATLASRWRCTTRNVAIAYGLDDTITVLKAVFSKSTTGAAEATWQIWKSGIRAKIQPRRTTVDNDNTSQTTKDTYRIFVESNIDVDHSCRIRAADGTIYKINNSSGADRIGELQVLEVELIK